MYSFQEIAILDETGIHSILDKYGSEYMISAIMKEYPDYYNLRGDDIRSLSNSEHNKIIKILKKEF